MKKPNTPNTQLTLIRFCTQRVPWSFFDACGKIPATLRNYRSATPPSPTTSRRWSSLLMSTSFWNR